jgi:hypothetical protein
LSAPLQDTGERLQSQYCFHDDPQLCVEVGQDKNKSHDSRDGGKVFTAGVGTIREDLSVYELESDQSEDYAYHQRYQLQVAFHIQYY